MQKETDEITDGLPHVADLFEARKPKEPAIMHIIRILCVPFIRYTTLVTALDVFSTVHLGGCYWFSGIYDMTRVECVVYPHRCNVHYC